MYEVFKFRCLILLIVFLLNMNSESRFSSSKKKKKKLLETCALVKSRVHVWKSFSST